MTTRRIYKEKKSQVTIFILLGVVLLFVFIFMLYQTNIAPEDPSLIGKDALPVKTFVDSCLERIGIEATHKLTEFGGNVNELVFDKIPTLRQMENNLSNYINGNIDDCLNDFEEFKSQGFVITAKRHEVKTSINEQDVTFLLKLPVEVKKSGKPENLKEFHFQYYGVNIPYLKEIAIGILKDPELLDRNWLRNEIEGKEIIINTTSYDGFNAYSLRTKKVWFNFGKRVG